MHSISIISFTFYDIISFIIGNTQQLNNSYCILILWFIILIIWYHSLPTYCSIIHFQVCSSVLWYQWLKQSTLCWMVTHWRSLMGPEDTWQFNACQKQCRKRELSILPLICITVPAVNDNADQSLFEYSISVYLLSAPFSLSLSLSLSDILWKFKVFRRFKRVLF